MQHETVITTGQLTRRFGETVAVNALTLEVYHGEVFGFLGHNGAGKTTTVRLLNGVLAPDGGAARVLGMSPVEQGPALRQHTGVLTETPSLDERLTGRTNLAIYADLYGVPRAEAGRRINELLEMFELADRGDDQVGGYSKGMKQRLALARALLHRPQLLFLDEPTAGLDPVAARQVHDLIHHTSREEGNTVFLCTHNLTEAQRLCDRVAVMEHGHMVAVGATGELARQIGLPVRFEIEVAADQVALALDTLRGMKGVARFDQETHTIRVTGADRELIPGLLAAMVGAGVRVYRVAPQEASLEDVYFSLHERNRAKEATR
ncbi:MAG: ABC transporter ATP-binding protein [Anaerolineae bacterium]|nr:ABC transporter ATP-binding protein [Anaerolineae bacterium]